MPKYSLNAWKDKVNMRRSKQPRLTKPKPKFGRGRPPLPYKSTMVRVPDPIIKEVLKLIIDFKSKT